MTSVHIHLYEGDGTTDAKGYVIVTPTTRRDLSAGGVALPVGTAYTLVDGEATMTLAPTGLTWCWEIREMTAAGTTRYISVVDSPTTVEYEDCADVDPTTLAPTADPEAAWWAMAGNTVTSGAVVGDDLILTRYDGTIINAGDVRGPQGDATLAISEDGTGGLVISSDTALTDDGSGGVTITI